MDKEEVSLSPEEDLLGTAFDRHSHIGVSQSYESDESDLDDERQYQEELLRRINFNERQLNHRRVAAGPARGSATSSSSGGSAAVPARLHAPPSDARLARGPGGRAHASLQRDSLDSASDGDEEEGPDTDAEEQSRREFVTGGADDISDDGSGLDFIGDASTPPRRSYDSAELPRSRGDAPELDSGGESRRRGTGRDERMEREGRTRAAELGPARKVVGFGRVESALDNSLSLDGNQQERATQRLGTPYRVERTRGGRAIGRREAAEDASRRRSNQEMTRNWRIKPLENVRDGEPGAVREHALVREQTAEESDEYRHNRANRDPLPGARRHKGNRSELPGRDETIDRGRQNKAVEIPNRSHTQAMDAESSNRVTLKHHSKIPVRIPQHRGHGEDEEDEYDSLHSAMQEEYNNMLLHHAALQEPSGDVFAEHQMHAYSLHRNNEAIPQTAAVYANDLEQASLKDKMVNSGAPRVPGQRKDILEANKQNLGKKPPKLSSYLQMHQRLCVGPAPRKLLWKRPQEPSGVHPGDALPSAGAGGGDHRGELASTHQHYDLSGAGLVSPSHPSDAHGRHRLPGQFPSEGDRAAGCRRSEHANPEAALNPVAFQPRPPSGLVQGLFVDDAGHAYAYSQVPGHVPGQRVFPSLGRDDTETSRLWRIVPLQRAASEQWAREEEPRSASPSGAGAPPPAPCRAEQPRHATERHAVFHTPTPPLGSRRNSDGCLDRLQGQQQVQQKNYKEYTLEDYKNLKQDIKLGGLGPDSASVKKKSEKIRKQQNYAKLVHEQNRSLLRRRGARAAANPSSAPEADSKSRRQQALEYARNVPRPLHREEREEPPAPRGERRSSPPSSAPPDPVQTLLDDLRRRHEQDKQAVAAFKRHTP